MSSSTDGRPPPFRGEFMSRRKHNLAAMQDLDAVIVGGCGHVGLPLALSLADCGFRVGINDVDQGKIEMVRAGQEPLRETGAGALLRKLVPTRRPSLSPDPATLLRTPTDVAANPVPTAEFIQPT